MSSERQVRKVLLLRLYRSSSSLRFVYNALGSRVFELSRVSEEANDDRLFLTSYHSLSQDDDAPRHQLRIRRAKMSDSHLSLLEGVLASLSSPISEQDFVSLSSIVGHDQLRDALDLIDRGQGERKSSFPLWLAKNRKADRAN